MAEYFDQPKTIHVYQHEIGASNDWPEAVEALVEALKLREDDSAFPEFVRTLREVYNNGGGRVDVPRFDDPLMDDLVSAASRVSSGLAMMERLEQPFETVPKLCFTWAYIADLLMKIWPDEQPNFGEPIILPADPCHFDDPNARFLPPYMRVDAMLTAGLAIPRVGPTMDTLSPAPSSWVAMSPPNHGTPEDCTMDDVSCTSGHHGGKALRHRTAGSNGVQWDNDEAGASGEGLDQLDSRVDDDEFHSSASSADPFIEADEHPSWECANWTTTEVSFSEGSQRRVFDTESPSLTGVDAGDLQDAQEGEQEGEDDERPAYDGMAIDGVEDDDEFEDEDYDMQADGDIEADDDDDEPARESEADTPYEDAEEEAEPEEAVLAHTQLLFHARDDFIDLGLLCVASPEKMPYAMSSALLQRRAVGVMDPMVGIVFGKYSTRIRLVLGWTSVPADIDCVEVHIAYGDHSSLPCRALAAFDVRKPAEALELAYCLSALREHTAAMVQRAQEGLSSALARNLLRWRLDMAGRQHADPDLPALRTRVEAWRGAVACSPRQWARCRPSIREAKVLQCGGSSSLSTCSRTTTTSGMSNKKDTTTSKTSRTTQGAKSSASTSFPKRTFHNGRLNFVEEALKSDSSIQCVLPYGRSTPYSASDYANLKGTAHLHGLTPCQVMLYNRGVVHTSFPRRKADCELFPHLKTIRDVMDYFRPIKLPQFPDRQHDKGPSITDTKIIEALRTYNEYIDFQDELAAYTGTDLLSTQTGLSNSKTALIILQITVALPFILETSNAAARADWPHYVEHEGRVICWDPLHLRFIGELFQDDEGSYDGMFLRMEYEVKIPRHLPLGLAADVRPYLLDGIMENGSSVQSMLQLRSDGRKRHDALRKKAPTSAWPKEVLEGYAAGEIAYAENLNNRLRDQKDAVSTWIKSSLDDDACYSRLREEPRQARCDALAGIRILDFPEEEEISPGMNACSLVEKDSPAPMPRTGVSSTVMFARAQELAQKDSDNPRGGLGLPDHKDLAQQALERVTHLGSGFASSSPPSSVDVLPANEDLRTPNSTSHDDEGASMRAEASTNMPEPPLMLRSLVIDFYFAEYKRSHDWVFTLQCLNQAYIYLTHSVHKMAALDIYECPAFCLATDGPIGYVYVAYGVKIGSDVLRPFTGPPVLVWIASRDPPKYDLTDYKQTIQFCTFLLCLRHEHAERVRRRFEEVRLSLVARVKQNDPTLRWTLEQQLDELKNKLDAFEQRQDAALRKVERLRRQHDAPTTVEGPAENGGRATSVDSGQPAGRARASGTTATSADSDRASQLARTRKSAKTTSSDVTGAGSSQPAQSQAATPAPGARSSHSQTLLPPQAQKRSARARSSSRVAARNQPLSDASLQVNPAGSSSQAGDSSQANPAETRLRSRAPSRAASGSSQAKPAAASSQAKPRSRAPSMSQSKPGSGSPQTNRTGGPSQPKSSRPAS